MSMNRLKVFIIAGGVALSPLFGAKASAQSPPLYQPDFQVELVPGKPSGVDIALLGLNGEETVGFYATLDPMHGKPLSPLWGYFYTPIIRDNFHNTDAILVKQIKDHLKAHGIEAGLLERVYQAAKREWNNQPNLRTNHPEP